MQEGWSTFKLGSFNASDMWQPQHLLQTCRLRRSTCFMPAPQVLIRGMGMEADLVCWLDMPSLPTCSFIFYYFEEEG